MADGVEIATGWLTLAPTIPGLQGKISEALAPAEAEADKAGKSSGSKFGSGFGTVVGAAAIGVAAVGAAVAVAGVGLYKVGEVFDDVTDTIRVGTGASGSALDGLVASAKLVGTSVPTSFETAGSTVADLNTRLGLSGKTLETIASQYIQAGNILGETVDINKTTAAFSAFGIEGAGVEGAMDSLFRVSQATGVGMNELAATVQTNAVPLKNLGFSFEDTAALAGSLDKAGLNTSATMASMGKSLVTLAKDGEEPQEAFKRTTAELGDFVKAGDTAGALNLASKVFGTKGAAQFVGALQSGKIDLENLTGAAGLTGDTILGLGKETADAAESWTLIKNKGLNALEPLGTAVFNLAGTGLGFLADNMDGVLATLTPVAEGIGGIATLLVTGDFNGGIFGLEEDSAFVGFLFDVRETLTEMGPIIGQVFGTLGSAIGPLIPQVLGLLSQFSPLGLLFKSLMPVLPQLADAVGGLAMQLGPVLGQVMAAVVPLVGTLVGALSGVFVSIMPTVVQLVSMLASTLAGLLPVLLPIITTIIELAVSLIGQLAPILMQLISAILPPVISIVGLILMAIGPLISMIAGLLIPIIQALMPVVITVFGVIANVITAVMQVIQGIIQVVTGIISGNWSMVWTGIMNILAGVWAGIVAVIAGAINIVLSVIGAVLGVIAAVWNSAWSGIAGFLGGIWNNIINGVSGMIGGLIGFFTGIPGQIIGALAGLGSSLFDIGKNLVQGLMDGVSSLAGNIGRFFLDLLPGWIVGPFKLALGINSPSKLFKGFGENIGEGVILGAESMQDAVSASMQDLVSLPPMPAFTGNSPGGRLSLDKAGPQGPLVAVYPKEDMSEENIGKSAARELMWSPV